MNGRAVPRHPPGARLSLLRPRRYTIRQGRYETGTGAGRTPAGAQAPDTPQPDTARRDTRHDPLRTRRTRPTGPVRNRERDEHPPEHRHRRPHRRTQPIGPAPYPPGTVPSPRTGTAPERNGHDSTGTRPSDTARRGTARRRGPRRKPAPQPPDTVPRSRNSTGAGQRRGPTGTRPSKVSPKAGRPDGRTRPAGACGTARPAPSVPRAGTAAEQTGSRGGHSPAEPRHRTRPDAAPTEPAPPLADTAQPVPDGAIESSCSAAGRSGQRSPPGGGSRAGTAARDGRSPASAAARTTSAAA